MQLVNLQGALAFAPTRDGYGQGLIIAGDTNKNVIVLCADLTESTRSLAFKQKYPERFVEVGVAEQHMAALAAGFAAAGKIPFIASYAMFSPGRNWEQIRTTIGYNNQPVKIAGAHAGISVGPDGATHQAIEDIAIVRPIPNMTLIVPCDAIEARKATIAAVAVNGPVYLRFAREKTPIVTTDSTPFTIGKAEVYADGSDVAIIACGTMVSEALNAALLLQNEGISATVINCHTIKPLDAVTILAAAKTCGCIVTAEEHQVTGGLGGAIAELVSSSHPVPIVRIGVQNQYGQSGSPEELLKHYGLKAEHISAAAKQALKLKFAGNGDHAPSPKTATKELASRALKPVDTRVAFKTKTGILVHSVPELHKAVRAMNINTFTHHVSTAKNDFAQWVADVHQDADLARALKLAKTQTATALVLGARISQLVKHQ